MSRQYYTMIESPVGLLRLRGDHLGLCGIDFCTAEKPWLISNTLCEKHEIFLPVIEELEAYFSGEKIRFTAPLVLQGTAFQRATWHALQAIPYGQTISYSQLAQQIGKPKAVRAVGAANGRNPIPIIIPCHRVIGRNGSLTGFAGGVAIKSQLLVLEGAISEESKE